jgi:hypothetical protein
MMRWAHSAFLRWKQIDTISIGIDGNSPSSLGFYISADAPERALPSDAVVSSNTRADFKARLFPHLLPSSVLYHDGPTSLSTGTLSSHDVGAIIYAPPEGSAPPVPVIDSAWRRLNGQETSIIPRGTETMRECMSRRGICGGQVGVGLERGVSGIDHGESP